MDQPINDNAGRPRTAILRVFLALIGRDWKQVDFEDEKRYRMQQFPWLRVEAYVAAVLVSILVLGLTLWLLSLVASPGGIIFWLLLPLGLLGSFIGLQVLIWIGSLLGGCLGIEDPEISVSVCIFSVLTGGAIAVSFLGGPGGLILGLSWLIAVGINGLAAVLERVLIEQ